jgi:hypothetical protein
MRQRKSYLIAATGLFFLLLISMSACAKPLATIEQPPASQKPAQFEVGPITFAPPAVMVGDTITVSATINNIGDVAGTYTATLFLDGQQADNKSIPVDPGSSQEVSFQLSKSTAGSYMLAIGNSSTVLTVYNWTSHTIRYDNSDGAVVGAYVDGEAGHIVHFTPLNKAFKVQKIRIFAATKIKNTSELDNRITVRIWDKDGNNLLWSQDVPWSLFLGGSWQEIKVPDVRVNDDFLVEVVTHSYAPGNPIDFVSLVPFIPPPTSDEAGIFRIIGGLAGNVQSAVLIGFDYPQSYIDSPSNRPETRSGYSYMGKQIDPGQKRLEGIQWLIRVEGEGAPGD